MATTQNDKQAETLKTAGNKFFTSKRYARAVSKYTDALLVKASADVASGILVNRSAVRWRSLSLSLQCLRLKTAYSGCHEQAYALLDKFDLGGSAIARYPVETCPH